MGNVSVPNEIRQYLKSKVLIKCKCDCSINAKPHYFTQYTSRFSGPDRAPPCSG